MKLEKIIINGKEYYQFVKIATSEQFINEVGDLFSDSNDIERQRAKMLEMYITK